jgi:hypothetical protein
MFSNTFLLRDSLLYHIHLKNDFNWICINCNEYEKVVLKIDDTSGSILFDGYWYTDKFREYLTNYERISWEKEVKGIDKDKLYFIEEFEIPKEAHLHYSKHSEKQKLIEEIYSDIHIYKYEVSDNTSIFGDYDEDIGGEPCFTPTYTVKLWFLVKDIVRY